MSRTGLVFAKEGLLHDTGANHPECPARLTAIENAFNEAGIEAPSIPAVKASTEELLRVHSQEHIDTIKHTCETNAPYPDPDTAMVTGSWDAALLAAGGAISACRAVVDRTFDNAFCATRPPGHHAEHDRAMGFCLFNNVAIAARWLRDVAGLDRVAILDWDVHHGNGTQHTTYDDPTIYYISLHQSPHYPGTGRADERGEANTNLNIPMPAGAPSDAWLEAVEQKVLPELERFDPDFLLISCGFDAHRLDPLADQNLESTDYAQLTRMTRDVANGRRVSLLEGGYNLDALGQSAVAHFNALQE